MGMFLRIAVIIFCFLLFTRQGEAADNLKLTMIGPEFPPYYYNDSSGEASGVLTTLYSMIVKNAGYDWTGTIVPAKRVMVSLTRGQYDSSILVDNPFLRDSGSLVTSKRPVSQMVLNAYHLRKMPGIASRDHLIGKRVVVMRGYGYGGFRKWLDDLGKGVQVYQVNSFSSAIKMIEIGRADYAILYDVNFTSAESELKRAAKNIVASNLSNVELFLHLNKDTVPDADKILDQLMLSYDELMKDGKIAAALTRPELAIMGKPTNDLYKPSVTP